MPFTSYSKYSLDNLNLSTACPLIHVVTLGQLQVKRVVDLLDLSAMLDALQLISELLQLDVEVDFVLSTRELSTASAG